MANPENNPGISSNDPRVNALEEIKRLKAKCEADDRAIDATRSQTTTEQELESSGIGQTTTLDIDENIFHETQAELAQKIENSIDASFLASYLEGKNGDRQALIAEMPIDLIEQHLK